MALTHVATGYSRIGKVLEPSIASGASRMPASPLVHEGLSSDKDRKLGPRTKVGGGDHATHRVRGNVTECKAVVMNIGNFKLARRGIAAERDHGNRRTANTPTDGSVEGLQGHGTRSLEGFAGQQPSFRRSGP